jgi:hypothetical protein
VRAKIEKLAKAFEKDHDNVSYEQAYAEILKTKDGAKLYSEHVKAGGN